MKRVAMDEALGLFNGRGRVLDVGYEEGYADVYKAKGFDVVPFNLPSDMHDGFGGTFDYIMCRHVLEHSICPVLVLSHLYDACLKQAVVVVPKMNKTMVEHVGHYTVLSEHGWCRLFELVGFKVLYELDARWDDHPDYQETRFLLGKA
jgi:hypothetical protein